jgi:hypothetical protein
MSHECEAVLLFWYSTLKCLCLKHQNTYVKNSVFGALLTVGELKYKHMLESVYNVVFITSSLFIRFSFKTALQPELSINSCFPIPISVNALVWSLVTCLFFN